jgi:cytochrome c oxidase cbb3-type subunit 3
MNKTMADMPNDFWSGWIILLTSLSFLGLVWVVFSIYFAPQDEVHEGEETVWDGDIREGNDSPPLWWFWLLLSAMVFSVVYLMLYPGLGSFSGAFRWSMGQEFQENKRDFDTQFASINEEIITSSIAALQDRPDVMKTAGNLFNENCAACHGYEAQGQASLFPSLRDDEWQWGNSPEQIEASIRHGRKAMMMGWQAILKDDGVENVSDYVLRLGTSEAAGHAGQAQYNQFCMVCHGAEGEGNPLLGAPNLKNNIWLYGGSKAAVKESIAQGRHGEMPAYNSRLDDVQVKMLVAWLTK